MHTDEILHYMHVPGSLTTSGVLVQGDTWNLQSLAGWRHEGRWMLLEVGWLPKSTNANNGYPGYIALKCGNKQTDVFTLGNPAVEAIADTQIPQPTYVRTRWMAPPGWDGVLHWVADGLKAHSGLEYPEAVHWETGDDVNVYAVFGWIPPKGYCGL